MSDTYNYPVEVERDEDGRHVVVFPDFGWGATDGATLDEALGEARDLLRELIAATIREGKDLPKPSRATGRRPLVVAPVSIALKAALYEAFRQAGMSQRRFARDLDIAESEVRGLWHSGILLASSGCSACRRFTASPMISNLRSTAACVRASAA